MSDKSFIIQLLCLLELWCYYGKQTMQNEMYTKVKEEQDALIALVKEDHSLVNSNNVPVWTAGGWKMRIRLNLQETELQPCQICSKTSAINSTFNY